MFKDLAKNACEGDWSAVICGEKKKKSAEYLFY